MQQNDKNANAPGQQAFPPAETGNAANPSPHNADAAPAGNQLLDEKAEKYLRESAPVEDYPDEQEWEEANRIIEKEKGTGEEEAP